MLENAVRICEAKFGMMALCKDGHFRLAAHLNVPSALSRADFGWVESGFPGKLG
jgi:hypothetical protein